MSIDRFREEEEDSYTNAFQQDDSSSSQQRHPTHQYGVRRQDPQPHHEQESFEIQSDASLSSEGQISPQQLAIPQVADQRTNNFEQGHHLNMDVYLQNRYRQGAFVNPEHNQRLTAASAQTLRLRNQLRDAKANYLDVWGSEVGQTMDDHPEFWEYPNQKRHDVSNCFRIAFNLQQAEDVYSFIAHSSMPGLFASDAIDVYNDARRQHRSEIKLAFSRLSVVMQNYQVFMRPLRCLPVRLLRNPQPFPTPWVTKYTDFLADMMSDDLASAFRFKVRSMITSFGIAGAVVRISRHMKMVRRDVRRIGQLARAQPTQELVSNYAVLSDSLVVYELEFSRVKKLQSAWLSQQRFENKLRPRATRFEILLALIEGRHTSAYVRRWTRRARRTLVGSDIDEAFKFMKECQQMGAPVFSQALRDILLNLWNHPCHQRVEGKIRPIWRKCPTWNALYERITKDMMPMDKKILTYFAKQMGQ